MELEFIKKGNIYEAIFEVPSDFNIHIELNKPSYLGVYQSSIQNGEYSFATEYKLNNIQKVYDIDFGALVYPKYIKVVSGSEVVSASVNFNEGGGSGNGSGEASTVEYWSMNWDIYNSLESNIKETILTSVILGTSELAKIAINENVEIKNSGTILYMHMYTNGGIPYSIMAISYNKMVDITADGNRQKSFEELLLEMEAQVEGITDCFSRITKEEFYNLEA